VERHKRCGMIVDGRGDVDWFLSVGMNTNTSHTERPVTKLTHVHTYEILI